MNNVVDLREQVLKYVECAKENLVEFGHLDPMVLAFTKNEEMIPLVPKLQDGQTFNQVKGKLYDLIRQGLKDLQPLYAVSINDTWHKNFDFQIQGNDCEFERKLAIVRWKCRRFKTWDNKRPVLKENILITARGPGIPPIVSMTNYTRKDGKFLFEPTEVLGPEVEHRFNLLPNWWEEKDVPKPS